jgi:hypothetical protein
LEITTVNQEFLKDKQLKVQTMARGFAWLDTGTHDSLSEASTFIEVLEKRQGLKVACLEGIAYRQGWIDSDTLRENAQPMLKNDYGKYLLSILEENEASLTKNLDIKYFSNPSVSLSKGSSTFSPSPSSIVFTTLSVPLLGDRNLRKRGCNRTLLACSEPLRSKVVGPSEVSPYFAGWDRLDEGSL